MIVALGDLTVVRKYHSARLIDRAGGKLFPSAGAVEHLVAMVGVHIEQARQRKSDLPHRIGARENGLCTHRFIFIIFAVSSDLIRNDALQVILERQNVHEIQPLPVTRHQQCVAV